jgi:hypothetical protein
LNLKNFDGKLIHCLKCCQTFVNLSEISSKRWSLWLNCEIIPEILVAMAKVTPEKGSRYGWNSLGRWSLWLESFL